MKRPTTDKVRDQPFIVRPSKLGPGRAMAIKNELQSSRRRGCQPKRAPRKVSYDPAQKAPSAKTADERNDLPIRGPGGSVQIGLGGIGIDLHPEAFAFRMPDDSLLGMHIRRGDIAILEPCVRHLREGDLVLLRLDDTGETLRRITYCGNQMFFQTAGISSEPLLAAWQYPFYGVVTAVLRPFEQAELLSFPREQVRRKPPRTECKRPMDTELAPRCTPATTRLSDEPPRPGVRKGS